MAIDILELGADKKRKRDFLDLVDPIYASDKNYVRPLDMEINDKLDTKKNPFFEHAEGTAWVAYKDGRPVGRVTAQIDHEHLKRYKDDAGFFGYLDTIEDQDVAKALLDEAARWLKARGMKSIRGPYSLSINEELGVLVDGFGEPPVIMMPHHHPYQHKLIEGAGFTKLKDFYAWKYFVGEVPPRAQKAHDEIAALPELKVRQVNPKDVAGELDIIMDIFNDAWSDNWGFVPATPNELKKAAEDLKLILMPEITRLAYIDGEPAAVALALPNLNELTRDFRGKLGPLQLAKLLYRLKIKGPETGRLYILGIKKKWRNVRKYAGLSAYLYVEMNRAAQLLGMKHGELSWTVEDNAPINVAIKLMGGKVYKTYRVYEHAL
ncbi:MAG TPA: GNAT family N-acetyltransferase [Polyangiaceae bacterium]|nr:GNAT family N-acetyltransferase [Polyangiaceae bacterium]